MKIGIDARPLIRKKSGIGIYLESMLNHLIENTTSCDFYLFSNQKIFYNSKLVKLSKLHFIKYHVPKGIPGTFYFEFYLAKFIKKLGIKLDVFWGTQQFMPLNLDNNCKKILTIHDLTYKIYPSMVDKKNFLMLKFFSKASLKVADNIICVSRYTKKVLLENYKSILKNKKIKVIWESADIFESMSKRPFKLKNIKYFLFIGNLEPRKNLITLLKAFNESNASKNIKLVICGKNGWDYKKILNFIMKTPNVIHYGYINNKMKSTLLKNCLAFIMPSVYEGFGIPIVEAMKSGAIAIAADNSSMTEIIGNKKLLFDTYDDNKLAKILDCIAFDDTYREELHRYCIDRSKKFSWNRASKAFIDIMYN